MKTENFKISSILPASVVDPQWFHGFNADPDPGSQDIADPDPGQNFASLKMFHEKYPFCRM
jgi:hypothetical protein